MTETGWGVFDDERVFDQPCKYEERLGGHSTYCKNPCLPGGRCEYRYTSSKWHSDCVGYEANPAYKGEWEGVDKPHEETK